jgi:death-on-curing protein
VNEPRWLTRQMVEAFHTDQLQQHQGRAGIRDENLLESALHRPVNKWHYGETDFATLAAAYGFGIASNHPFVDGNKRVAFVSMVVFLRLNGLRFSASQADVVEALRAVADRRLTEEQLADWVRSKMGSG